MTRTGNPNYYISLFEKDVAATWGNYQITYEALSEHASDKTEARKWLCANTALELGQRFETFLSDWMIAAISRAPERFREEQDKRLESVREKIDLPEPLKGHVNLSITPCSRLAMREIHEMLDPKGQNITFSSAAAWRKAAQKNLSGEPLKAVMKLLNTPDDAAFYDYFKALRNALAHGSPASLGTLNEAAQASVLVGDRVGSENISLVRGKKRIGNIGSYLNAVVDPGARRVGVVCGRLESVVKRLEI